jgi:hypothetical protein
LQYLHSSVVHFRHYDTDTFHSAKSSPLMSQSNTNTRSRISKLHFCALFFPLRPAACQPSRLAPRPSHLARLAYHATQHLCSIRTYIRLGSRHCPIVAVPISGHTRIASLGLLCSGAELGVDFPQFQKLGIRWREAHHVGWEWKPLRRGGQLTWWLGMTRWLCRGGLGFAWEDARIAV